MRKRLYLAMLSYVHGLHATSKDNCAWYDETGTTNYPKGCNNNALGDTDDKEILYECSDTKIAQKGNTGGANHFERTTHNGQTCGIADLNGLLEEVALGVIMYNASSNVGKFMVMKDSVSITQFTKDNVQDDQTTLYDWQSTPPCYAGATANTGYSAYWGHSSSNTFFTNQNGINRAYCGLSPLLSKPPLLMNLVKIMRMPTGGAATPLYCAAAACGRTLLALACSIAASTATEA